MTSIIYDFKEINRRANFKDMPKAEEQRTELHPIPLSVGAGVGVSAGGVGIAGGGESKRLRCPINGGLCDCVNPCVR